jgi:hypothetical protein
MRKNDDRSHTTVNESADYQFAVCVAVSV